MPHPIAAISPDVHATDPRAERTRTAVLSAAFDLLIADGPDGVTHGQVAAAANVSRTTVYKYFPTRGELLRATIEVMGKPVPRKRTGDLRNDLERILGDLVADLADEQRTRVIAAMIERAQHDPTVAAVRDDLVGEARHQFLAIVQSGIDNGELRPETDADLAMSGLIGTFFFKRLMAGENIDDDLAARVIEVFLASHRRR